MTEKTTVFALVDTESGAVRSQIIPNVSGDTLRTAIEAETDMGATTLVTDEWKGYKPLASDLKGHERVNHSRDQYVNERGFTTNQVEAYFGQLKRSIDGTHHAVSQEHLHRYLAQHDFLRSTHTLSDTERMLLLVEQTAGRRLTYSH